MRILDFCCSLSKAEFPAEAEKIDENEKPPSECQRPLFPLLGWPYWMNSFHEPPRVEAEKIDENEKPPSDFERPSLEWWIAIERRSLFDEIYELHERQRRSFDAEAEKINDLKRQLIDIERELIECQRPRFPLLGQSVWISSFYEPLDAEAEKTKALPFLFPNQKPGKFPVNRGKDHLGEIGEEPVNKGGKDHLGELGKEQFNKGGKDPGHDGWDFVLDAEPQIMRITALAA